MTSDTRSSRNTRTTKPHAGTSRPAAARDIPTLVDISTIAEHLDVSVRHVRRLVAERRIPYVKWGNLLRFDPRGLGMAQLQRHHAGRVGHDASSPQRMTSSLSEPPRVWRRLGGLVSILRGGPIGWHRW